jgi:hypothetical protein
MCYPAVLGLFHLLFARRYRAKYTLDLEGCKKLHAGILRNPRFVEVKNIY